MALKAIIRGTKITKTTWFLNPNENKGKFNSKYIWCYKKNKNNNTTCAKSKSNNILLQKRNRLRLWQENVPKTSDEQTKNNEKFYVYLYPSDT